MDLNAKQEQLHLLYVWITQWVLGPGILLQICIILLCLGLATWISRQLSQKITMPKSFHKNHPILQLSWRIVLSMIFPLSLLFLLGLIMLGYKTMGVPYQLLQKTANIAMAWALILFGSTFIRNVFFSRLVAILIISITTLHMLGYLQLTINWLDGLKLGSEKNSLSVYDLISSTFSIAAFVWGALFLSNQLDNALRHKSDMSLSTKALLGKLVKFLLVAFAFLIGLHTVGIDLTAFAFFGGAVAVGIGLGLQKVFSNLIAGIILHIAASEPRSRRILATLRENLTLAPDAFAALLKAMQASTAAGGLVARAANRHLGKSDREAAGVLSAASSRARSSATCAFS